MLEDLNSIRLTQKQSVGEKDFDIEKSNEEVLREVKLKVKGMGGDKKEKKELDYEKIIQN